MLASSCSQPPAPREGTRPNFLHSQEEEPSHLAESAGQAPRGQRPWGFCNVPGSLPAVPSVLTVRGAFHVSDCICPSPTLMCVLGA